jgi:ABC-type transport system involved in cytochrome c biogenesis permease subunit
MALKGAVEPLPPILHSVWFPLHVGISLLGDAVFALAFSASVLYLIQERRLKAHRGRGKRGPLPSLETLDRVSHTCLVWGLVLLTFGVVSGIVWAHVVWSNRPWMSDPKILFTLLVWLLYVVLLQGRMTAGWRGRWAAQLTIAGFLVIVFSLVGVNVLGIGIPRTGLLGTRRWHGKSSSSGSRITPPPWRCASSSRSTTAASSRRSAGSSRCPPSTSA